MEGRVGAYISGAAHLAVIVWLLIGGALFQNRPPKDLKVTNVSLISKAQFAALQSSAPKVESGVGAEMPAPKPGVAPAAPRARAKPKLSTKAKPAPAPARPSPKPDLTALRSAPKAQLTSNAPKTPLPPAPDTSAPKIGKSDAPPTPRPTPRVAPIEAPAPAPDVKTAAVVHRATTPNPAAKVPPTPARPATAPKAATTRIVTQAEQVRLAPKRSSRPKARPQRRAQAAAPTAASSALANSIAAAVSQANSAPELAPPVPVVPSGPPLSAAEKDGFRVAVSNCWNVGSLSSSALLVTVTVGVSLSRDGRVKAKSIRLISSRGGSGDTVQKAYDAARRAIIICGRDGYSLPRDKYDRWKDIEIVFDPKNMRLK